MMIAGLDIGTHNIKLLVAETKKGEELKVLKVLKIASRGMRKGAIYDMDEAVFAAADVFALLRKDFRAASKNIYVNVNGAQVRAHTSKGIIAVSRADSEIYKDDIDRVIKASQAINISPNRKIIHTLTREYIVDGVGDIEDPTGLVGSRLEVESVVVDAFSGYFKNLTRLIEMNGGRVGGFVLGPLASAKAALTKNQKELGVVLIDIGAQTTGIAVYEENKLLHTAIVPMGSEYITRDISIGFKIPVADAESAKLNFGYAVWRQVSPKEDIEAKAVSSTLKSNISRRYLSEIVESRMSEIFDFVNKELKDIGKSGQLPAGAVLTGGGAKLPGIVELAKQELRMSTQVGYATGEFQVHDADYSGELEDPSFVCAVGLALCAAETNGKEHSFSLGGSSWWSFTKSFFQNLLP